MMDLRRLDAVQLDALREVANIGAGHAATALSQLTQQRVMLSVPEARVIRLEEATEAIGDPERVVAAVMTRMLGDATGRTVQIFPDRTAVRLAGLLLRAPDLEFPAGFGPLEQSTLKEIGSIVISAHLKALSDFMGMLLAASAAEFRIDMMGAVLQTSYLNFGPVTDHIFLMNSELLLGADDESLRAHLLLLPDDASLHAMLRAIGLA
jgi:chemotaxis protein CheC